MSCNRCHKTPCCCQRRTPTCKEFNYLSRLLDQHLARIVELEAQQGGAEQQNIEVFIRPIDITAEHNIDFIEVPMSPSLENATMAEVLAKIVSLELWYNEERDGALPLEIVSQHIELGEDNLLISIEYNVAPNTLGYNSNVVAGERATPYLKLVYLD